MLFILALGVSRSSAQQTLNMTVLSQLSYPAASDIWGYTTEGGVEYAILGTSSGTAIIDVGTDPSNPVEVAFITGPPSGFRDMKTHLNYAYVVTEGSADEPGGGLQIIDLSDPPNATLAATYTGNGFSSAHNIYVSDGFAYPVGANIASGGLVILDLADPLAPLQVGAWTSSYIHDVYVRDDTAYAASPHYGVLRIIDVTDKSNPDPVAVIGGLPAVHNAWTTEDANFLLTTQEMGDGHLRVWDISDLENTFEVGSYQSGSGTVIHNVHVRGDFAYISYYERGVRIVDIVEPRAPVEVGFVSGGEMSTGGVYPYLPSGTVLASGYTGLTVAKFDTVYAGRVTGVISDSATGMPLADALIRISGTGNRDISDADGTYITGALPGSHEMDVTLFGYSTRTMAIELIEGSMIAVDVALSSSLTRGSIVGSVPREYSLSQNHPNPFNPETVIEYALPIRSEVNLTIYNLRGQEVALLINGNMPAGNHRVSWDASNFASGIYFYRLQAGDFMETRKMVLLK